MADKKPLVTQNGGLKELGSIDRLVVPDLFSHNIVNTYPNRSAFVSDEPSHTWVVGDVVTAGGIMYEYDGTTTDISDMPGWKPFGDVTPFHFKENTAPRTTSMLSALQAAVTYAQNNKSKVVTSIHGGGDILVDGTVTISSSVEIEGSWASAIVNPDGNYPVFDIVVGTSGPTIEKVSIRGVRAESTSASVSAENCFVRFSGGGDSSGTAYTFSRGLFENNHITNFRSGFRNKMNTRTVSAGEAGGVNWTTFSKNFFTNILNCYDMVESHGTGNIYTDDRPFGVRDGGSVLNFQGTASNTVVGDTIIKGMNCSSLSGTSNFVTFGPNLTYLARVIISNNQADAGTWNFINYDSSLEGEFNAITVSNNSFGGSATLSAPIATRSRVIGEDVSHLVYGRTRAPTATGTGLTLDFFTIDLLSASSVAVNLAVDAIASPIVGDGIKYAKAVFSIVGNGSTMTIAEIEQSVNDAASFLIEVVSVSATQATVRVAYDQTTSGTSDIYMKVAATNGGAARIKRA